MTVDDWFYVFCTSVADFCGNDVVGNVYLVILKSNDQLSLPHFCYKENWTILCSFFCCFVLFSCLECTLIWHRNLLRKALFRIVGQLRWILFHQGSCWTVVVLLLWVVVWLCLVDGLMVHLCKRSCYLVCGMTCKFHLWGWRWRQGNLLLFCFILLLFLVCNDWKLFFIHLDSLPHIFLNTAMPSSQYKPMSFLFYFSLILFNIKMPINSQTSAPSYAPIVTSKRFPSLFIQSFSLLKKSDFLTWCIICMSSLLISITFLQSWVRWSIFFLM